MCFHKKHKEWDKDQKGGPLKGEDETPRHKNLPQRQFSHQPAENVCRTRQDAETAKVAVERWAWHSGNIDGEKGELQSVCQGFPGAVQGGGCGGSALQAEDQPLHNEGNTAHAGALSRWPQAHPNPAHFFVLTSSAAVRTKEAVSTFLVKNMYFRFLHGPTFYEEGFYR